MTHPHRSFRQHLLDRAQAGHEPVFVPTDLPPLRAFAALFDDSGYQSFEVTKWLPADGLTRTLELTAEVVTTPGGPPETSTASWSGVAAGVDPYAGFGIGTSSVLWGGEAEVPPPDDARTRAFLLLVTTDFVHLSAERSQVPPLVRGALDGPGDGFDYVVLAR